jgi:hypothetical protein
MRVRTVAAMSAHAARAHLLTQAAGRDGGRGLRLMRVRTVVAMSAQLGRICSRKWLVAMAGVDSGSCACAPSL